MIMPKSCIAIVLLAAQALAQMDDVEMDQREEVKTMLVEPGSETILSCGPGSEYYSCSWDMPSNMSCLDFKPQLSTQCRREPSVFFNGTLTSCDIVVKDVKRLHSGVWTCRMKFTEEDVEELISKTQVDVFEKAVVDWKSQFGLITVEEGSPFTLTCQATHSRPPGKFYFHLGADPTKNRIINTNSPKIEPMEQPGMYKLEEELTFIPKPEHDGQKVYCSFNQIGPDGTVVSSTMVDVDLRVEYLSLSAPPRLPPLLSGATANLSVELQGSPQPEIVWKIKDMAGTEVTLTEGNQSISRYTLLPLNEIEDEKNGYISTLLVRNVNQDDMKSKFVMQVVNRKESLTGSIEFKIMVDTTLLENPISEGVSVTVIVVVSVILALVLSIIVALTVLYAKKNQKFCFQTSEPVQPNSAQDQLEPLQGQASSIIKSHPYSRPS